MVKRVAAAADGLQIYGTQLYGFYKFMSQNVEREMGVSPFHLQTSRRVKFQILDKMRFRC